MITLVLGGTRSGKSSIAERLALRHDGPLFYVATGEITDDDMAARVRRHQQQRDARFRTVEAGLDLAATITAIDTGATGEGDRDAAHGPHPILIDTLSTWLARHDDFVVDVAGLTAALRARRAPTIVVSDEVGSGVHPETEVGRLFRDRLGELNQAIAEAATDVYFVVAGRILAVHPPSELGI